MSIQTLCLAMRYRVQVFLVDDFGERWPEIVTGERDHDDMCSICDGGTFEESRRFIELTIIDYGWALRGVHPAADDPDGAHWTHTIGLLESFNHPELVLTDVEYETAGALVNELGEDIRAGRDITKDNRLGCTFRDVHPAHLDSELLAAWFNNYGYPPAPGQVWQVVLPDAAYCAVHAVLQTDLSRADHFPGSVNSGPTDLL